jgi:glycosyltransferase involved in cell wall biosynthesis
MRNRIALIWQGITDAQHTWEDGLRMAVELLKKEYHIEFIEPDEDLEGYDALIYWESPVTIMGPNQAKYNYVRNHSTPSILLFSGGPVNAEWVRGFDYICVESQINKEEFAAQGVHTYTAFGINDTLFRPSKVSKKFKGVHHGTCASWKRQGLVGETFKEDALLIGRHQESDPYPFIYAKECGATVLPELKGQELVDALCSADTLAQTSDFWGGGQRATLEAMACGIPVICMEDSPKNREYVEESGAGLVCPPDAGSIKRAYDDIMKEYDVFSKRGIEYVKNKWTAAHYAYELNNVIKLCLKK